MKIKFDIKKLFIRLILLIVGIYSIITLINQQKKLDSYDSNIAYLTEEIEEQQEYNTELIETKENINSLEYIEAVAREKLNMYMPNEKVYIDVGN